MLSSNEIQVKSEFRPYNLAPGERLNRATCLSMCERLFGMDAETAGADLSPEERVALVHKARQVLCYKLTPEHDTLDDPIEVVVRSVPVRMYGEALRHYYLRIEDVLDVHPGTNHRIALAWWHNTTQQEADILERRMFLCGDCLDALLDDVWTSSQRFNIVYNNCDQMLNRCEQSTGLGVFIILIASYVTFGDLFGAVVLLLAFAVYAYTCRVWYNSRFYAMEHPHYTHVFLCEHAKHPHAEMMAGWFKDSEKK